MSIRFNRPKKHFLCAALIVLCCLSFIITFALSSERVAGVKAGEWIEYRIGWEDCPYSVYQTRVRREIVDSSGSIIKVNITTWWSNGTLSTEIRTGDVSDGTGSSAMIFIPANLTTGDTVYIEGFDPTEIKGEEEREYLGFRRKVVYSEFISRGFYVFICWDKLKGVALEINIKHILSESEKTYDYAIKINIDGTNMLVQLSNNATGFEWIFPLLMVIIIASFLIFRRRWINRKRKLHRPRALPLKIVFQFTHFLRRISQRNNQISKQIPQRES